MQQEFTKKIGFSSLSLGGMFLADDPLIYCACPTVAHLVGSQHYGQNLISVQIPSLVIPRCTIRIDKYFFLSFEIYNVNYKGEVGTRYQLFKMFLFFFVSIMFIRISTFFTNHIVLVFVLIFLKIIKTWIQSFLIIDCWIPRTRYHP